MHPAASVILFTTASGAGYGLLLWLALCSLTGLTPTTSGLGLLGLGLSFALITAGLLSSTFHLGRPERALLALTQWRSSWLAREGVAAIATYVAAGPFALGWIVLNHVEGAFAVAAALSVALGVLTVVCTAMIYASLKPIRQWNNAWTPLVYLLLATSTGAILLVDVMLLSGVFRPAAAAMAFCAILAAGLVKIAYWRSTDAEPPRLTLASATGLSAYGSVRILEQPHTEENYVMREMGFQIARRHAAKLRHIVVVALFLIPAPLMLIASVVGDSWPTHVVAACATLSAAIGVGVERWLFFAAATHASMLYYGRSA